ncbi:MAG: hypothetical protein ACOC9B_06045 [Chloroflexota bacterium]
MRTSEDNTRVLDVGNCARCGKDHKGLAFHRLNRPFEEEEGGWTFFAICPETNQPILMKDIYNEN